MGLKVTPDQIKKTMESWPVEKRIRYNKEIKTQSVQFRKDFWHQRAEDGKVIGHEKSQIKLAEAQPSWAKGLKIPSPAEAALAHDAGVREEEPGFIDKLKAIPGNISEHLGLIKEHPQPSILEAIQPEGYDPLTDHTSQIPMPYAAVKEDWPGQKSSLQFKLDEDRAKVQNKQAINKLISAFIPVNFEDESSAEQRFIEGRRAAAGGLDTAHQKRLDKLKSGVAGATAFGNIVGTASTMVNPLSRAGKGVADVFLQGAIDASKRQAIKEAIQPSKNLDDVLNGIVYVGASGAIPATMVAVPGFAKWAVKKGSELFKLAESKGPGIFANAIKRKMKLSGMNATPAEAPPPVQAVAEKVGALPPVQAAKDVAEEASPPHVPVGEIRETGLVGELTDDLSTKTQKTLVPHMEAEPKPLQVHTEQVGQQAPQATPPPAGIEPTAPQVPARGSNVPSRHAEYQLEGDQLSRSIQEAREALLSDESGPAWHRQVSHDDMAKNADRYLRRLLSDKSLPDAIDHQMVNVAKNADGAIPDADFVANAALIRYTDNVIKDLPVASPERLALEDKLNRFMNDQVHNRSASGRSLNVTKMIHRMNPEYQFDKARTDIKTAMMNNGLPEQQAAYIAQGQVDKVKPFVAKILKTADKVDKGETPSLTESLNQLLAAVEGGDMRPGMATIEKPALSKIQLEAIAKKMRAMAKAYDENLIAKVAKSTGNKSDDIAIKETKRLMAQIESLARKRSTELGTLQTADMAKLADGGDALPIGVNPELVGAIDYLNKTVADLKATMQPQELFKGAKNVKAKPAAKVKATPTQEGAVAKLMDSVNKLGYAIEKTNDMRLSPEIVPENILNQTRYTNKVVTDLLKDLESGAFKKRISTQPHADSVGGQLEYLRDRLRKYKSDFEKDEWARQVINGERPIATPVIGEPGTATQSVQDIIDNAEISLARETGTGKPVPITVNGEIIVLNSDQARAYAAGMLEDAVPVSTGKKMASGLRMMRLMTPASRLKDTISTMAAGPFNYAEQVAASGADYILSGGKLAKRTRLMPSPSARWSGVKLAPSKVSQTWKTGISGRPFHTEGTQTYLQHAFGKGLGKGDKALGTLSKAVNASMNIGDNAAFYREAADELSNEIRLLAAKSDKMDEVRKIVNDNGGYGELASMSHEQLKKTFKGVIDIPEGAITRANERGFVGVYEDPNMISHGLKGLKRVLNTDLKNKGKQREFSLGNIFADFAQVPGSVMNRAMAYSTANAYQIIKTGYNLAKHRASDAERKAAQREFADAVGRGTVGASLLAAGAAGKRAGLINVPSLSDKQTEIDKAAGYARGSVNIGGYSVPLALLGPVGIPALVGAKIQDRLDTGKDLTDSAKEVNDTVTNALADVVETSGQGGIVSSAMRGPKKLVENIKQNLLTLPVPGPIQAGIRGATEKQGNMEAAAKVEESSPLMKGLKNMVNPIKASKISEDPKLKYAKIVQQAAEDLGLSKDEATAFWPSPIKPGTFTIDEEDFEVTQDQADEMNKALYSAAYKMLKTGYDPKQWSKESLKEDLADIGADLDEVRDGLLEKAQGEYKKAAKP